MREILDRLLQILAMEIGQSNLRFVADNNPRKSNDFWLDKHAILSYYSYHIADC